MSHQAIDFEQLKPKIIELAQANDTITLLWLYGSHASGNAHEKSDIDLAVAFKDWEADVIERRLRPELLALDWQHHLNLSEGRLSILDINNAPIPIAMAILQKGQLLLAKNKSRQLREQQRIMSQWEIDYLYHYRHQQAING